MKRLPMPPDLSQEAYFYRKGWNACIDEIEDMQQALESLCQWLLGPDSPEGREASARFAPKRPSIQRSLREALELCVPVMHADTSPQGKATYSVIRAALAKAGGEE